MAKRKNPNKQVRDTSTSVGQVRAARALDAVTSAFVKWCTDQLGFSEQDARHALGEIHGFVGAYFERVPAFSATEFAVEPFTLTLAELLSHLVSVDEDQAAATFESVHLYIDFLRETGLWTGAEDDLEAIHGDFHDAVDQTETGLPELSAVEELAGLAGTELVRRLENLLRWIGDGQAVTSTGALKLKDIEAAGAAVGVAVVGRASATAKNLQALKQGSAVRYVKSMHQEPMLAKFWAALEATRLINVTATRVRPTSRALRVLDPQDTGRLDVLRDFTTQFLLVSVLGEQIWAPWIIDAAMAQTATLTMARNGRSVSANALAAAVDAGEEGIDQFAPATYKERMEVLAELGLVQFGDEVTVPPFMAAAVDALTQMADVLYGAGDALPGGLPDTARRLKTLGSPTHMLTLKVSLQGAKPPIWRRLVVRPDLTLREFHEVLQASFDWEDYHLHEFRVGGLRGVAYGPPSNDFDFEEPPLNEADYTIGDLLPREKAKIDYIYDFGDFWRHAIVVEKVLPYDDGVPAVRCSGGRGAAPAEDSGGVWGWESLLAALVDPAHEEHEQYREWMMLEPGEIFDAGSFDARAVNEQLVGMFGEL